MMTKTESIWLNPAAAYAMWIEAWTAWYIAALTLWMPLPVSAPVAGGIGAKGQAASAPAAVRSRDSGGEAGGVAGKAANGAIAGQAVNGHCAW